MIGMMDCDRAATMKSITVRLRMIRLEVSDWKENRIGLRDSRQIYGQAVQGCSVKASPSVIHHL